MNDDIQETLDLLREGIQGDQQALSTVWDRHRERLGRLVRLRLDRRLQGRIDPSDVLQEAFIDFAARAKEYVESPEMPFFLWLRFLTGQRLQLLHRHHLGTQMRDAGREVSLHRGAMPQATSMSLATPTAGLAVIPELPSLAPHCVATINSPAGIGSRRTSFTRGNS